MKKNLILGTGTGYKYEHMRNFVASLKTINFKGDIVLLVSDQIDAATKSKLLQQGVNLIFCAHRYLSFSNTYTNSRLWKVHYLFHKLLFSVINKETDNLKKLISYVKWFHLISGSRYCFYYEFLSANQDKYDKVLVSDIRDVVFQADPFNQLTNQDQLKFYCEEHSIGDSFYTAYWIKNAFGKKELKKISDEISICSGTTMADTKSMLTYLEAMVRMQAQITGGLTGQGGFDQGVHNFLIYNGHFPSATLVVNNDGEVATLGNSTVMALNDEKELVDQHHRVIPVVHQYDRFPDLKLKAVVEAADKP